MSIVTTGTSRQLYGRVSRSDFLIRTIREEYVEMPCMRLTRAQFRRLWDLTPAESEQLVGDLIANGFLVEDPHGRIGRQPDPR